MKQGDELQSTTFCCSLLVIYIIHLYIMYNIPNQKTKYLVMKTEARYLQYYGENMVLQVVQITLTAAETTKLHEEDISRPWK